MSQSSPACRIAYIGLQESEKFIRQEQRVFLVLLDQQHALDWWFVVTVFILIGTKHSFTITHVASELLHPSFCEHRHSIGERILNTHSTHSNPSFQHLSIEF